MNVGSGLQIRQLLFAGRNKQATINLAWRKRESSRKNRKNDSSGTPAVERQSAERQRFFTWDNEETVTSVDIYRDGSTSCVECCFATVSR